MSEKLFNYAKLTALNQEKYIMKASVRQPALQVFPPLKQTLLFLILNCDEK